MIVTAKGTVLAYTEARTGSSDWSRMDILLYRLEDHAVSFDPPIVLARGTGACAAVAAAVRLGLCREGTDIVVKLLGGDLVVNCKDGSITLLGACQTDYSGTYEY